MLINQRRIKNLKENNSYIIFTIETINDQERLIQEELTKKRLEQERLEYEKLEQEMREQEELDLERLRGEWSDYTIEWKNRLNVHKKMASSSIFDSKKFYKKMQSAIKSGLEKISKQLNLAENIVSMKTTARENVENKLNNFSEKLQLLITKVDKKVHEPTTHIDTLDDLLTTEDSDQINVNNFIDTLDQDTIEILGNITGVLSEEDINDQIIENTRKIILLNKGIKLSKGKTLISDIISTFKDFVISFITLRKELLSNTELSGDALDMFNYLIINGNIKRQNIPNSYEIIKNAALLSKTSKLFYGTSSSDEITESIEKLKLAMNILPNYFRPEQTASFITLLDILKLNEDDLETEDQNNEDISGGTRTKGKQKTRSQKREEKRLAKEVLQQLKNKRDEWEINKDKWEHGKTKQKSRKLKIQPGYKPSNYRTNKAKLQPSNESELKLTTQKTPNLFDILRIESDDDDEITDTESIEEEYNEIQYEEPVDLFDIMERTEFNPENFAYDYAFVITNLKEIVEKFNMYDRDYTSIQINDFKANEVMLNDFLQLLTYIYSNNRKNIILYLSLFELIEMVYTFLQIILTFYSTKEDLKYKFLSVLQTEQLNNMFTIINDKIINTTVSLKTVYEIVNNNETYMVDETGFTLVNKEKKTFFDKILEFNEDITETLQNMLKLYQVITQLRIPLDNIKYKEYTLLLNENISILENAKQVEHVKPYVFSSEIEEGNEENNKIVLNNITKLILEREIQLSEFADLIDLDLLQMDENMELNVLTSNTLITGLSSYTLVYLKLTINDGIIKGINIEAASDLEKDKKNITDYAIELLAPGLNVRETTKTSTLLEDVGITEDMSKIIPINFNLKLLRILEGIAHKNKYSKRWTINEIEKLKVVCSSEINLDKLKEINDEVFHNLNVLTELQYLNTTLSDEEKSKLRARDDLQEIQLKMLLDQITTQDYLQEIDNTPSIDKSIRLDDLYVPEILEDVGNKNEIKSTVKTVKENVQSVLTLNKDAEEIRNKSKYVEELEKDDFLSIDISNKIQPIKDIGIEIIDKSTITFINFDDLIKNMMKLIKYYDINKPEDVDKILNMFLNENELSEPIYRVEGGGEGGFGSFGGEEEMLNYLIDNYISVFMNNELIDKHIYITSLYILSYKAEIDLLSYNLCLTNSHRLNMYNRLPNKNNYIDLPNDKFVNEFKNDLIQEPLICKLYKVYIFDNAIKFDNIPIFKNLYSKVSTLIYYLDILDIKTFNLLNINNVVSEHEKHKILKDCSLQLHELKAINNIIDELSIILLSLFDNIILLYNDLSQYTDKVEFIKFSEREITKETKNKLYNYIHNMSIVLLYLKDIMLNLQSVFTKNSFTNGFNNYNLLNDRNIDNMLFIELNDIDMNSIFYDFNFLKDLTGYLTYKSIKTDLNVHLYNIKYSGASINIIRNVDTSLMNKHQIFIRNKQIPQYKMKNIAIFSDILTLDSSLLLEGINMYKKHNKLIKSTFEYSTKQYFNSFIYKEIYHKSFEYWKSNIIASSIKYVNDKHLFMSLQNMITIGNSEYVYKIYPYNYNKIINNEKIAFLFGYDPNLREQIYALFGTLSNINYSENLKIKHEINTKYPCLSSIYDNDYLMDCKDEFVSKFSIEKSINVSELFDDILIYLDSIISTSYAYTLVASMIKNGINEFSDYNTYETFYEQSNMCKVMKGNKILHHILMNTQSNILLCKLKLVYFNRNTSLNSYYSNLNSVFMIPILLECFSIGYLLSRFDQRDSFILNLLFVQFIDVDLKQLDIIIKLMFTLQNFNKTMTGLPDIYLRLILFHFNKYKALDNYYKEFSSFINMYNDLLPFIVSINSKNKMKDNYDLSLTIDELFKTYNLDKDTLYVFLEETITRLTDRSLIHYSTVTNENIFECKHTKSILISFDEIMLDNLFGYKFESLGTEKQNVFKDINYINNLSLYNAYSYIFNKYKLILARNINYIKSTSVSVDIRKGLIDDYTFIELKSLTKKMMDLLNKLNTIKSISVNAKQQILFIAYNLSKINIKLIKIRKHVEQSPLRLISRYRQGVDYNDQSLMMNAMIELAPIINKNSEDYIKQLMSGLRIQGPLWNPNIIINEESAIKQAAILADSINTNNDILYRSKGLSKTYI